MAYAKKPVNPEAPSNHKVWTKQDDSILKEMVQKRATSAQIAIALGRTKASVWGRKYTLGLKGRLSSSKGKGIFAPTTISEKNRKGFIDSGAIKEKVEVKKIHDHEILTMDLATISKIAKRSGAKIVIPFE